MQQPMRPPLWEAWLRSSRGASRAKVCKLRSQARWPSANHYRWKTLLRSRTWPQAISSCRILLRVRIRLPASDLMWLKFKVSKTCQKRQLALERMRWQSTTILCSMQAVNARIMQNLSSRRKLISKRARTCRIRTIVTVQISSRALLHLSQQAQE